MSTNFFPQTLLRPICDATHSPFELGTVSAGKRDVDLWCAHFVVGGPPCSGGIDKKSLVKTLGWVFGARQDFAAIFFFGAATSVDRFTRVLMASLASRSV